MLRKLFSCFGANEKPQVFPTKEPHADQYASSSASLKDKDPSSSDQTDRSPDVSSQTLVNNTIKSTKALCVVAKHTYAISNDVLYPTIETADELIIRVKAVGLNPIDWKSVDYNFCMPSFPWIGGREAAGTVEAVGSNVKDFSVGDRVYTSTYYRDRRAGTFQELCVVPQHTVLPLPTCLSFETGACLGVAALTAAMTLWKWLDVPIPSPSSSATVTTRYVLIWGGSTVTGQFAIQLASLSGLRVIAVTSAKTRTLAERLGAAHVIVRDEKTNDEIVGEIRAVAGDNLTLAIDIVGSKTAACCLQALSQTAPSSLAALAFLNEGEHVPENITMAPIEMKRFIIDFDNRRYAEELNRLASRGSITMPEIEVLEGGLERIEQGLEILKAGDMGGRKLVVRI